MGLSDLEKETLKRIESGFYTRPGGLPVDNPDEVELIGPMFSIHCRRRRASPEEDPYGRGYEAYEGFVYLGVEVVFHFVDAVENTPDGIADFAGVLQRKFAQRLAAKLAE